MRIVHRISIATTRDIRQELAGFGVVVPDTGFVTFEIDEEQEVWPALEKWVARHRAVDVPTTRFTKKEVRDAQLLELVPDWHHGYPQPREEVFGYREATYDLGRWCEECGVGMEQKAPFQMKAEPKWGKRGILQLNWVFDEFFVRPDVWSELFEPHGVQCRQVMNTKGKELQSVVQLVIDEEVGVVAKGLEATGCRKCGRKKYLPMTRGRFPALTQLPATMAKTREYFGSGAAAHRRVIVPQALGQVLVANKMRGASLRPVELSPSDAT